MKIYTKTGDKGETGLIGGRRVSKASARIEAYGTADELNALLGVIHSQLVAGDLKDWIIVIQNELHILCADLANADLGNQGERIEDSHVQQLENLCDQLDADLAPLSSFILPSGSLEGSFLHYARTVARRAERRMIELNEHEEINGAAVRYINRLSDLFFLMARTENKRAGRPELNPEY